MDDMHHRWWSAADDVEAAGQRWFACYTRANHEKRVAAQLSSLGIESYLPIQVRDRKWSDRRKRVGSPLFPSYVFVRIHPGSLAKVFYTYGLIAVVRSCGRAVPIADGDIENIRRFVDAINSHTPEPDLALTPYPTGTPVTVRSGAFAGVQGIVIKNSGHHRVVVGLSGIGCGVSVELLAASIEPIPAST